MENSFIPAAGSQSWTAAEQPQLTQPKYDVDYLKRKWGKIYLIEVENPNGEPLEYVLRQPDRTIMAAVGKIANTDPFKAGVILVENCLLYGDKTALEDMTVFSAVAEAFEEVNKSRKATIKNL